MNIPLRIIRFCLFLGLAGGMLTPLMVSAAGTDAPIPAIIEDGFKIWAAKDASYAFDVWKKGGLLEMDPKPVQLSRYFRQIDRTIGKFKSFESIESKPIGQSSRIIYLGINFEHGTVYARFLIYHTDHDWVVQNMDFSPKPEAVMPWLAFTGEDYSQ